VLGAEAGLVLSDALVEDRAAPASRPPEARIARMDVDTTSGKWAHTAILDRVGRGEVDILLGTQMIAKGLDFPNVTLVGVIDADIGINLPDFRSSERSFQLLSQVAGRAGRGPKGGEVVIQTRVPSHHAVRCAVTHDYHAFVEEELPARESPPYPPTLRLANIVVRATRSALRPGDPRWVVAPSVKGQRERLPWRVLPVESRLAVTMCPRPDLSPGGGSPWACLALNASFEPLTLVPTAPGRPPGSRPEGRDPGGGRGAAASGPSPGKRLPVPVRDPDWSATSRCLGAFGGR
jgi:hypothetical protein